MLAMLIGCGLRRGELLALRVDSIQLREEHWVIADLLGKAGHIRTVPIPVWVKAALDEWKDAGGITEGALFPIHQQDWTRMGNRNDTEGAVGDCPGGRLAASIDKLAPHDLRRSRASFVTSLAANWIKSSSCLDTSRSDNRALPRLQAEVGHRSQRQNGHRA